MYLISLNFIYCGLVTKCKHPVDNRKRNLQLILHLRTFTASSQSRKCYSSCRASQGKFPLARIELSLVNTSGRVDFSRPVIVSDRGQNFMSKLVSALCELFQVTRHHTSSFHPECNSVVERTNSTLAQAIRSYCNVEQNNWHKQLPAIMMAFRNAQSATTGYTPYELVFGRQMRTPLDTALIPKETLTKTAQEHMQELVDSLKLTNLLVTSNRLAAQARQKQQHDRTAKEPDFRLRQQVMLKKQNITPGLSKSYVLSLMVHSISQKWVLIIHLTLEGNQITNQ